MDQAPQPEDIAANTEREERRADVQRRIDEVAGVLAETVVIGSAPIGWGPLRTGAGYAEPAVFRRGPIIGSGVTRSGIPVPDRWFRRNPIRDSGARSLVPA